MFVCSCRGVTDRVVRDAVADGAASVDDVALRCGAGGACGGCWPTLERLLAELDRADRRRDLAQAVA